MSDPSHSELATPLPPLERIETDEGRKLCCAAVYEHPAVRWLLGGDLHPGGESCTRRALELGRVRSGDRLLDVASGRGSSALLAAGELGCEVVGLDYGEDAIAEASAATEAAGLGDRVGFRQGDAEALTFADQSFDAVLCECSLCTFPDKQRAVGEMVRVLRPGGRLVLADVTVDRARLPAELLGPLSVLACVGDAATGSGYERLLGRAGLQLIATERRDEDAKRLARRVQDRLRGARLLGVDRIAGAPVSTAEAIDLLGVALHAIDDGALGYAIFVAERTRPDPPR